MASSSSARIFVCLDGSIEIYSAILTADDANSGNCSLMQKLVFLLSRFKKLVFY